MSTVYTFDEFAAAHWDLARIELSEEPSSDGFRRSWIMLMPEGTFKHPEYGTLDFSRRALADYKANFDRRVLKIDVALDVNHQRAEAPGWLEKVELREAHAGPDGEHPAGLWGLVRWTPLGEKLLREQTYGYFSPDLQPYTDERSGRRFERVIRGGGLVNRPFLKEMPAVQLTDGANGEVSTRPWGEVDKSQLPASCFLDPAHRRLPIYEGAGPKVKGRYTKRGKLNIHGAHAALAAIHGARSGKAMTGLPDGTVERLQQLIAAHEGSTMAELRKWRRMEVSPKGGTVGKKRGQTDLLRLSELEDEDDEAFTFDDEDEVFDEDDDEEGMEFADGADEENPDDAGEAYADGTEDDNPDDGDPEDSADGGDDEDEELPPAPPKKRGSKAGGKRMGDKGMKSGGAKCAEPSTAHQGRGWTLSEQRAAFAELAELRAAQAKAGVREQIERWNKALGKDKALSRVFAQGYIRLMEAAASGSNGGDGAIRLSESDTAAAVNKVIELALTRGVVDTSVRGGSFEMEDPEKQFAGMRLGDAEKSERRLHGVAVELAEKAGKAWGSLTGDERGTYLLAAEKRLAGRAAKR